MPELTITWIGNPITKAVVDGDEIGGYLWKDYEIGLREDGVVVWRVKS